MEPNPNTLFGKAQITCFLRILISNKYLKKYICIQEQQKYFIKKLRFLMRPQCMPGWVSEWRSGVGGVKEVTDTSCSTQQQRRLCWAKRHNCITIFFFLNRFLYLNWVPEAVYNFREAEFDREVIPWRCISVDVCSQVLSCSLCLCRLGNLDNRPLTE